VERGVENLRKHIENIHKFHLPAIVAINRFAADGDEEVACVHDKCDYLGVKVITADHWARGGAGAEALATEVAELAEKHTTDFKLLYESDASLWSKARTIAQEVYGANDILGDKRLRDKFRQIERQGYGRLPICMAKTQYSLSTDPGLTGRPTDFDVPLRDVRLAAGAGFVIVLTGDIMRMPGLPRVPAAEAIDIDENGEIVGLF
jgi:formate--tetrahydrofolate ligase